MNDPLASADVFVLPADARGRALLAEEAGSVPGLEKRVPWLPAVFSSYALLEKIAICGCGGGRKGPSSLPA
ncbi:MAG: hypothetical protein PHO89_06045 [Methylacidiphilaceae bacterium]|nr:hypothetical protein [Candidatus Methylacidiphilaceae bacterium]